MLEQTPSRRAMMTLSAAAAGFGTAVHAEAMQNKAPTAAELGIARGAATIRQQAHFRVNAAQVYRLLTDAKLFDRVVTLSEAAKALGPTIAPAQIAAEPGGAFSLFGGYISGRQIELSSGVRLVQAWRSASWPAHIFSIVRFEISGETGGARLVLDHAGFPSDQAVHLASGWQENYLRPMAKVLAPTG